MDAFAVIQLHVGTVNESKIAAFTEIPFQEEASWEVRRAAGAQNLAPPQKGKTNSEGAKYWFLIKFIGALFDLIFILTSPLQTLWSLWAQTV